MMRLLSRLLVFRQARSGQKEDRRQKLVEKTAYQLYQNRLKANKSGDESADWVKAQKIVRNPVRHFLYITRHTDKAITAFPRWVISGVVSKTSWEWLELLIIPLFLATGAFYLESQAEERQERIADARSKQETLTNYFEQMKGLLLNEKLRDASQNSEVRSVARAITTTTITELNSERNALLIVFLKEANLLQKNDGANKESLQILAGLSLSGAKLSNADFRGADLRGSDFSKSDLREANLSESDLGAADFSAADLSEANLRNARFFEYADFSRANLSGADLSGAKLGSANFSGADLSGANLSGIHFTEANFSGANFQNSFIYRSFLSERVKLGTPLTITQEQLGGDNPPFLCNVILPKSLQIDGDRDCGKLVHQTLTAPPTDTEFKLIPNQPLQSEK